MYNRLAAAAAAACLRSSPSAAPAPFSLFPWFTRDDPRATSSWDSARVVTRRFGPKCVWQFLIIDNEFDREDRSTEMRCIRRTIENRWTLSLSLSLSLCLSVSLGFSLVSLVSRSAPSSVRGIVSVVSIGFINCLFKQPDGSLSLLHASIPDNGLSKGDCWNAIIRPYTYFTVLCEVWSFVSFFFSLFSFFLLILLPCSDPRMADCFIYHRFHIEFLFIVYF